MTRGRKRVTDPAGAETAEKDNTIIVKANRVLTESEHRLMLDRMREQEKRTGMKIIVIPHSADIVEEED